MPGQLIWACLNPEDARDQWIPVKVGADGSLTISSPLDKGVIHNTAYVTPDDFFAAALAPTNTPCRFRCAGAFSVAGVLDVTITRALNTQTMHFNHGVVLTADCLFEFDVLVEDGDTINYQYGINCNILTFRVLEIPGAI